jgi:hypothetical protein
MHSPHLKEVGLSNDAAIRELGKRYRETVLARGGF